MRVATLTVSTSRSADPNLDDESGPALAECAAQLGGAVVASACVPDERRRIEAQLIAWCDGGDVDLILTSGGTGLAPTDVTPEATRAIIHREVPGIAEAMRQASAAHTPYWMLSRAIAGTRGPVLIINFPGNPAAVGEVSRVLVGVVDHASAQLRRPTSHT